MPRRVEDIVRANHRVMRDTDSTYTASKVASTKSREKEREINIHRSKEITKEIREDGDSDKKHAHITTATTKNHSIKWRFRWLAVALGIFIVIAAGGFFSSTYYSKATFTIVPKVVPIVVNSTKTYFAKLASTSTTDGLTYEFVTLNNTATTTVPATNGSVTNTKATGKITVYNSFSAQPVRLIAGTRLSGSNDMVYRLTSSITIPGYTKPATDIVPGKISASIIADLQGQSYNIPKTNVLADFKVINYKGSPRYDTVYGRQATDIAGGFAGVKKIISPTALASTTAKLKASLSASLLTQVKSKIPSAYIMYDNGFITTFSAPIIGDNKPGTATITEQGTIYGIIFKKSALIDAIAGSNVSSRFGNFAYTTFGLESLDVTFNNIKDITPGSKDSLIMHIKGNTKIVGTVPVDEIKRKLAGVSLGDTEAIFRSYGPVIESANGELLPPWAKVPKDLSRIDIIVEKE